MEFLNLRYWLFTFLSAGILVFSSWLARTNPRLAGFIIALPVSSMIALALNYTQWTDAEKTSEFARSIFISIPISLLFFVPFFFAKSLRLPFWGLFFSGVALLGLGYWIQTKFSY